MAFGNDVVADLVDLDLERIDPVLHLKNFLELGGVACGKADDGELHHLLDLAAHFHELGSNLFEFVVELLKGVLPIHPWIPCVSSSSKDTSPHPGKYDNFVSAGAILTIAVIATHHPHPTGSGHQHLVGAVLGKDAAADHPWQAVEPLL